MSEGKAKCGAVAAWRPLAILVTLRVVLGLSVGAVPAGAVVDRVRHFPSGELALFERDGVLVAELVRRAPSLSGLGVTFAAAAVLAYALSFPLLAAVIHTIAHGRGSVAEEVARGLRQTPALVLAAGLSAIALGFAIYLGGVTSASLVALFPPGTPSRAAASIVFGSLGLVPAAFGAAYFDLVRVQVVLGDEGWGARLASAWRTVSRAPVRTTLRYASMALGAAVIAACAVALSVAALVRPGAVFVGLGVLTGLAALVALAFLRAVWLGFLVRLSTIELEPLRLPEGLEYEATSDQGEEERASQLTPSGPGA